MLDIQPAPNGGATFEMTLLSGVNKGAVVSVTSSSADPDDLAPMGVGATIVVLDGEPSVILDPT